MYFHTDDARTIDFIERVANLAAQHGQSLRIDVDSQGRVKVKRGEGGWSPPIDGTPDPYRDNSHAQQEAQPVRLTVGPDGKPVVS